MKCIAHTKDGKNYCGDEQCQPLEEHLLQVAQYAKQFASTFGAEQAGELIGILHDYGKYSKAFQDKIRGKKIKANHAMAGACTDVIAQAKEPMTNLYGLLVAGHHMGMQDFNHSADSYPKKLKQYLPEAFHEVDKTILQMIPKTVKHKSFKPTNHKKQISFAIAYYLKMLFSSLVDADFTDTEEFCSQVKRQPLSYSMDNLFHLLMNQIPKNDGSFINNIRESILNDCLKSALNPLGLFSLTVPTGGGKTISSLAFALAHAKEHGLSRVIYVIPYTSIIEQNAKVFKNILGNEFVLEHHSNFLCESDDFQIRWATENWDIPIVVTTNVQFFESIFSNRPSKNRKLHNMANSVVIFDEAQMLPTQYLSPCLYAISELVTNYRVSAVLCSATQPKIANYIYKDLLVQEIASNPLKLAKDLKRVQYEIISKKNDDEIISMLLQEESGLVVLNSRKHVFSMYQELQSVCKETNLYCLSTLLPPLERSKKIKEIKEKLNNKQKVYVISTQLIEAGVDIDFPVVFRAIAGIDSIIQAGGRANREGKKDKGYVYVFEPSSESGKIPRSLKVTSQIGKEVIELLGNNAFELEGIEKYFDLLYHNASKEGLLDEKNILNEFELEAKKLNFETVSHKFQLIEDNSYEIIIPLDENAKNLVQQLRDKTWGKNTIRQLSQYGVSVYSHEFSALLNEHSIENINNFYVLSNPKRYKPETGLDVFSDDNFNGDAYYA